MALGSGFSVLNNPFTTPKPSGPGPSGSPYYLDPQFQQQSKALDFFRTQYGPQQSDLQTQQDLIMQQLGFANAGADADRAALQARYSTGLESNALGLQGIDLDRLGLDYKREGLGLDRESLGIEGEVSKLREAGLGLKREGIEAKGTSLRLKETELDALKSITDQLYGVNTRQANEAALQAQQGIRSDNTARGSTNTPGYGRALGWVGADLKNRLESLGLGNKADQARYENSKGQFFVDRYGLGLEGKNLDLEYGQLGADRRNLDIAGRRLDISGKELDLANQQLDLRAKGYGISGQELRNTLNEGLQKIGLNEQMDANKLMLALNSNDMDQQALAQEIWRTAMEYSPMFATNSQAPAQGSNTSAATNDAINQFIGR